jgi:SNF2 family DNA or RNA helicase
MGERVKLIHSFQEDPAYRLIILAIDAAGEGITLHAAHNVILAEPSPVPGRNAQAIARAHRKGQKHPVLARFVTLPGTIDQRLMNIIARKTRDILRVIDPDLAKPEPQQEELFPERI